MKELVINHNGQPCTTSRLVAEKFGKEHKNVLRAIENLKCSKEFIRKIFKLSEYTDKKGQSRPEYLITGEGFSFLVMGFTGKNSARIKEELV